MRNDENRKVITKEQYLELKGDVDQLKGDVDRRFDQVDKNHAEFKTDVNRRFDQVDKNHAEFKTDVNRRFDQVDKRLDKLQGWMIGTGLTIIITIVATVGTFSTMVMFSVNSVS